MPSNHEPEWLNRDSDERIAALLRDCQVCQADEEVLRVERAGEGNMNLTLRVVTTDQIVIVKQSRPWVEKYPQIAAPVGRILQELRFYEAISSVPDVAARMPRLLGSCPEQYVIVLEHLDGADDASVLYQQADGKDTYEKLLPELLNWLGLLHQIGIPAARAEEFANGELRQLNHEHIFLIPFAEEPALDLNSITPGLASVAKRLTTGRSLRSKLEALGKRYLQNHTRLVHGDFFPGSWMLCEAGVQIIDPEFAHGGLPEFDLGVLLAHGYFLVQDRSQKMLECICKHYPTHGDPVDWELVEEFAAVELLRRLLGVAQLPVSLDLAAKTHLIEAATAQLLD